MTEAMQCVTQRRANDVLAELITEIRAENPELSAESADYAARQRIGYYAGHMSHEVRARVERLFKTVHPIFGSIRFNGPPTPAQAARLGIEYGQATRDIAVNSSAHRDAWTATAEIPRVDARRVPCKSPTGILWRALDENGNFDNCDIATLTCDSLIRFLRSEGGRNVFAEGIVLRILGHELPENLDAPVRAK